MVEKIEEGDLMKDAYSEILDHINTLDIIDTHEHSWAIILTGTSYLQVFHRKIMIG